MQLGQRILAANGITEGVQFRLVRDYSTINAYVSRRSFNTVGLYRGLLEYVESDDELAAVLPHEIAHLTIRHSRGGFARSTLPGLVAGTGEAILLAAGGAINPAAVQTGGNLGKVKWWPHHCIVLWSPKQIWSV